MAQVYVVFDENDNALRIFSTEKKAENYVDRYKGYLHYEMMLVE